jgi:1-acyl-sn-glycerol-3-phosphate acyltransferase
MSNHSSLYDIPLIFMALPGNIRMVTKKELFDIPVWGHAMKACKFIAIDRKNSTQAIEDLKIAQKQMEEEGVIPWVSPEGTRSRDGKLNPFKAGGFFLALQTNAIIIPVGIRGARDILPAKTLDVCLHANVEVHIGEPIDTSEYSIQTRKALIHTVRESIKSLADITE